MPRNIVSSLLAFAMGMQNALIRRHGVPDVATNLLTITVTSLIADSVPAGGRNENWQRRIASVTIFIGSALVGAVLTTRYGPCLPLARTLARLSVAITASLATPD